MRTRPILGRKPWFVRTLIGGRAVSWEGWVVCLAAGALAVLDEARLSTTAGGRLAAVVATLALTELVVQLKVIDRRG